MGYITNICWFIIFIILSFSAASKPYFSESKVRTQRIVFEYTIKQYDSKNSFKLKNKHSYKYIKGLSKSLSTNGKYLAVQTYKKRKETDELILYTAEDFKEIRRIAIGKPVPISNSASFFPPFFDKKEQHVYVRTKEKRKKETLNCYHIASGKLIFSIAMPNYNRIILNKEMPNLFFFIGLSQTEFSTYEVYNSQTGERLQNIEKFKSKQLGRFYYRYIFHHDTLSVLRQQRKKGKDKYFLLFLNPNDGSIEKELELGTNIPIYTHIPNNDEFLYISYKKGAKIVTQKLFKDHVEKVVEFNSLLRLKRIVADGKGKFLYASNKKMQLIDANNFSIEPQINSPFDIRAGIFSQDSSRIFVLEGMGSEVGIIDFTSKTIVARTSTGRVSVKIAKIFATTTTLGLYAGYFSVFYYQGILMTLDRQGQFLYVGNEKTNDVTLLNTADFSNKNIIALGSDIFAVLRLNEKYYPHDKDGNIIAFSTNAINYLNNQNTKAVNKIEFKELIGLDSKENFVFVKGNKNNTKVYELSTGKFITVLNGTTHAHDFYFKADPRHDVFL